MESRLPGYWPCPGHIEVVRCTWPTCSFTGGYQTVIHSFWCFYSMSFRLLFHLEPSLLKILHEYPANKALAVAFLPSLKFLLSCADLRRHHHRVPAIFL